MAAKVERDPSNYVWIWTPDAYEKVHMDQCRVSVPDGGRSVRSHQCTRAWRVKIGEYGFCTTHAKKVKERMELV